MKRNLISWFRSRKDLEPLRDISFRCINCGLEYGELPIKPGSKFRGRKCTVCGGRLINSSRQIKEKVVK